MIRAMVGRVFRGAVVLAAVFAVAVAQAASPLKGIADANKKDELTPTQRQRLKLAIAKFNRTQRNPLERAEAVDEALQVGAPGARSLAPNIERELAPARKKYQEELAKAAAALAEQKKPDADEVQRQRDVLRALRENDNLTKEMIDKEGVPALKRLRELLSVNRQELLAPSEALRNRRDEVLALGTWWARCQSLINTAENTAEAGGPVNYEKLLAAEEDAAAQATLPIDPAAKAILDANKPLLAKLRPEEAQGVQVLNTMRIQLGLRPLEIDSKLADAARDHCHDMAELDFFAHESPVSGKKTPWDRAKNFGTTAGAENIAMARLGSQAIDMWFHSPGHHRNMLGNHRRLGLGQDGKTFTLMLGG